jgi:hypothetical protein
MSETRNILIISLTVLLAVVIYCFGSRYQMVGLVEPAPGPQEIVNSYIYMCDRVTGKMYWSPGGAVWFAEVFFVDAKDKFEAGERIRKEKEQKQKTGRP